MQFLGSIKRKCDSCKEGKKINLFEDNGEQRKLCNDCLFKEYGIGKEEKKIINNPSHCRKCGEIIEEGFYCEECK